MNIHRWTLPCGENLAALDRFPGRWPAYLDYLRRSWVVVNGRTSNNRDLTAGGDKRVMTRKGRRQPPWTNQDVWAYRVAKREGVALFLGPNAKLYANTCSPWRSEPLVSNQDDAWDITREPSVFIMKEPTLPTGVTLVPQADGYFEPSEVEVFGKGWPGLPQHPPQGTLGGETHHTRGVKESGAMNVEGGSIAGGKIPRETGGARSNPSAEDAAITPASSPSNGAREAIASAHAQGGKGIKQLDGRTGASHAHPT